jgi:hypothetical protein
LLDELIGQLSAIAIEGPKGVGKTRTADVADKHVKHLRWLRGRLGDQLLDQIVITTGPSAYRRDVDGIAVVPFALLGH